MQKEQNFGNRHFWGSRKKHDTALDKLSVKEYEDSFKIK